MTQNIKKKQIFTIKTDFSFKIFLLCFAFDLSSKLWLINYLSIDFLNNVNNLIIICYFDKNNNFYIYIFSTTAPFYTN